MQGLIREPMPSNQYGMKAFCVTQNVEIDTTHSSTTPSPFHKDLLRLAIPQSRRVYTLQWPLPHQAQKLELYISLCPGLKK